MAIMLNFVGLYRLFLHLTRTTEAAIHAICSIVHIGLEPAIRGVWFESLLLAVPFDVDLKLPSPTRIALDWSNGSRLRPLWDCGCDSFEQVAQLVLWNSTESEPKRLGRGGGRCESVCP